MVDIGIVAGSHAFHAVVSMKKTYEGEDRQVLQYLLATQYFKFVTVVDDDIDPHNSEQVEWAKATRAGRRPEDYIVSPQMPTWEMDPEIDRHWRVTKLGILATRDIGESYTQPAPDKRNDGENAASIRKVHTVAAKFRTPINFTLTINSMGVLNFVNSGTPRQIIVIPV